MSLAEIDVHDLGQFSSVVGGAMRFILPSTIAFEYGPRKALRESHAFSQPLVVGVFDGLKICLIDGLLFRERAVNRVVNHVLADPSRCAWLQRPFPHRAACPQVVGEIGRQSFLLGS